MNRTEVLKEVDGLFGYVPDWLKDIPDSALGNVWEILRQVELEKNVGFC